MRRHAPALTAVLALLVPAGVAVAQPAEEPAPKTAAAKGKDGTGRAKGRDPARGTGATTDPRPDRGRDGSAPGRPHIVVDELEEMPAGVVVQDEIDDEVPAPVEVAPAALAAAFQGFAAPPAVGREVQAVVAPGAPVSVRLPGAAQAVPLAQVGTLPVGTVVDARRGAVVMRSALPSGAAQHAVFAGTLFDVQPAADGYVDLALRGAALDCGPRRARAAAASKRRPRTARRTVRRLWGADKGGRYRTHGRDSVATVRGTIWMVEESCAGTRTKVLEGAVDVRDRRLRRTVRVKAGQSYLARRG